MLTHTTKKHLKHSGLIIKNLVGKGNQTPNPCYNNSMIITPLAQTNCSNYLVYYIILKHHVALAAH